MSTHFEDTLPAAIRQMLAVDGSELGDYSDVLRNQTILARLAMRRALKAAAMEEYSQEEVVEMGDAVEPPNPEDVSKITERAVNARMELADRANRTLTDIKTKRLEAIEKFQDKAADKPKPANITFQRVETSPRHLILRYLRLNRVDDAKLVAKDHNIPWTEFEHKVQTEYVEA